MQKHKQKSRGRPKLMQNRIRVIIQLDECDYDQIKKAIHNKKSVAQFFRDAATLMLNTNSNIISTGNLNENL